MSPHRRSQALDLLAGLVLGGALWAAPDDTTAPPAWKATMYPLWPSPNDHEYKQGAGNDPQNALSGNPTGYYSFHTNKDDDGTPSWWMVDFGQELQVDSVKISNRGDDIGAQGRAVPFKLWLLEDVFAGSPRPASDANNTGPDGNPPPQVPTKLQWKNGKFNKKGQSFKVWTAPFGGYQRDGVKEQHPGPATIPINQKVRFLKIEGKGGTPGTNDYLHLDQVEITVHKDDKSTDKDLNGNSTTFGLPDAN